MATVEPRREPDDAESLPPRTLASRRWLIRPREPLTAGQPGHDEGHGRGTSGRSPWADMPLAPAGRFSPGGTGTDETSADSSRPTDVIEFAGGRPDASPLLEAARDLVQNTPEGHALEGKLEAFDKLEDSAKERAAPGIHKDIADIVARAVTEAHHRTELLNALATFRNDQTLAASGPAEREVQHPFVAELVDVVEGVLAELGKEMLIEVVLPGAHVLLPPTDFVESLFTAVEMIEIAGDPARLAIEDQPAWLEIEDDPFWSPLIRPP